MNTATYEPERMTTMRQHPVIMVLFSIMALLMITTAANAQSVIYEEDFSSYSNGTTTSSKWSINAAGCNTGTNQDYFEVQAGRFEARDIDCEAVWTSSPIDISSYQNVSISVDLQETGSLESNDYIKLYYKLNNGSETAFSTNGINTDDFSNLTASQTGLNGNTLQIVIRVRNDDGGEKHRFDDIEVKGTYKAPSFSVTLNQTDISCFGENDGAIDLEVNGSGSGGSGSGGCSTGTGLSSNNCSTCTSTAPTSGTLNINSGQVVCIPAGSNFSGHININGGTLVICGNIIPWSFNFNSGTVIVNSVLALNNSFNVNGRLENYGTISISSDLTVNSNGSMLNHGNLFISGSLILNSPMENYGPLNVSNQLTINSSGTLTNGCSMNVSSAITVNSTFNNNGSVNSNGSMTINGSGNLNMGGNSLVSIPGLTLNGRISHSGGSCASVKVSGNTTINGSGQVTANIDLCDANGIETNWGTINGVTNCSCNATGSNTASSYTYQWSTGASTQDISGLAAGTYTVTVSNGTTSVVESITITEPSLITISGNVDMCTPGLADGSIEASATGGVPPYTFAWNNGDTTALTENLAPGTHIVTVTDANGCGRIKGFIVSYELVNTRCIAVGSGEWSTTADWWGNCHGGGGQYPNELDTALIIGYDITVDINASALMIIMESDADDATGLTLHNNAILDVVNTTNLTHLSGGQPVHVTAEDNSVLNARGNINLKAASSNKVVLDFSDQAELKLKQQLNRIGNYGKLVMTDESTISFEGSTPQQIPGNILGDSFQYQNLKVNNSAGSVSLMSDVTVSNKLILTNGVVNTGNHKLTLLNPVASSISGGSEDSYISGTLRRHIGTNTDEYLFPVGHPDKGTYDWLELRNGNLQGVNYVTVSFTDVTAADLLSSITLGLLTVDLVPMKDHGMWVVEPDRQPNGGHYSVKVSTENFNSLADNSFELVKRESGGSPLDWGLAGGIIPLANTLGSRASDGFTTLSGLTTFSEFGLRETEGGSSLPIQLLAFSASPEGGKVRLEWSTAVEINNEYFTVERSEDGLEFTEVTRVEGAGNSSTQNDYVAYDPQPLKGTSYYRLKQTDYDGGFEYSDMLPVTITTLLKSDFKIVPNPNTGTFTLDITSPFEEAEIQVLNNFGQLVHMEELIGIMGNTKRELDLRDELAAGIYFVKIDMGSSTFIKQMVIE